MKTSGHSDPAHYNEHGWCRVNCKLCGIAPQGPVDHPVPVPHKENAA